MGSKLSIDKHVSNLEDILNADPTLFSNLQIENNIPDNITQNIKIWRYYEDDTKAKSIKSAPICLNDILNADFTFLSNECYLVLFVYRKNAEETVPFSAFPPSMWGLVESYTNLTPRGLETPVASSEPISNLNKEVLESFLLPKRAQKQDSNKFEHMLFVWNGKTANPLMKAIALSKALEFDTLIHKGKDPLLQVLFSGGYIKNKKLSAGKIIEVSPPADNQMNQEMESRIDPMKETVYLMKFLFPAADPRGAKPNAFKEKFLRPRASEVKYEDEYVMMGDFEEESEFIEESQYNEDSSPMSSPSWYAGKMGSDTVDDFLPLDSARPNHTVRTNVPKLTISLSKTQNNNPNPISGFEKLRNIEGDIKMKTPNLPNLGLRNVEIKIEAQISSNDAESQEVSEEVRPLSSSDRTSEGPDSRGMTNRKPNSGMQLALPTVRVEDRPNRGEGDFKQIKELICQGKYTGSESSIRPDIIDFYSKQCSELIDGFLFVAGQKISSSIQKLEEFGITHIINAAGDVCENPFTDKIKYLTFYIKDDPRENIECVFYDVFDFIENAREQGGKVLVHCVQGVSRSVTLCISYMMLKHQYTYQNALEHIRGIRGIASPNVGFWGQLLNFHKRLYDPFESIPTPRVFCVGSYQKETPQTIVVRWLHDTGSIYHQKTKKLLDPRSVIILQGEHALYLWIGNEILPSNKERYIARAEEHIRILQKYEHASQEYSIVNCGEEPHDFWSLWANEPEVKHGKNNDWNSWLVDLALHKNVKGTTLHEEVEEEEEEEDQEHEHDHDHDHEQEQEQEQEHEETDKIELNEINALFRYPNLEALNEGDMDKQSDEENLLVLCTERENEKLMHVWRGVNVSNEVDEDAYINAIKKAKWPDVDPEMIQVFSEVPNQESNSFMDSY